MNIAITRPEGKGAALADALKAAGFEAQCTPVLSLIAHTPSTESLLSASQADVLIFISQDAVAFFAKALHKKNQTLASDSVLIAVGATTATAIQSHLNRTAFFPAQADSEGVLSLSELYDLSDKSVALIKGVGGRTKLAEELTTRGAGLSECEVYCRTPAKPSPNEWLDHWQQVQIEGIVFTSNAAVDAVWRKATDTQQQWLKKTVHIVVSARTQMYLSTQFKMPQCNIVVSEGASNDALFKCIYNYISFQGSAMNKPQESQQDAVSEVASSAQPDTANLAATTESKQAAQAANTPISKVGILALILALSSGAGVGAHFMFNAEQADNYKMQITDLKTQLAQQAQQFQGLSTNLAQLNTALLNREEAVKAHLEKQTQQVAEQIQLAQSHASQEISKVLKVELAYLTRLASFKAQVQKDPLGAIEVLKHLDDLVASMPDSLPLRQAISSDISRLQSQPLPQTESRYFSIQTLIDEVNELPLKSMPTMSTQVKQEQALTENVEDWMGNIKRSWWQFRDTFLRVQTEQNIAIEPLLNDNQKQLAKLQVSQYLQQAQIALLETQHSIYFSSLKEAESGIEAYFDNQHGAVRTFKAQLKRLQKEELVSPQSTELETAQAIKGWMK